MNEEIIQLQTRCVSHEIRNQISICEMYSEIIKKHLEKESYENNSVYNAIDCIQKALKLMGNSLLDLKSINMFEPKVCELKYPINEAVRLSTAYIQDKNITIDCFVKNSDRIYVDENKFIACIVNIIKNAVEAIEIKGKIHIIAEVKDNYAHIKISNTGKPVPKEKQATIFQEGYTTKTLGSGLGLYICKSNLQSQKAELRLNKSTKALTEFEIIIPVYDKD